MYQNTIFCVGLFLLCSLSATYGRCPETYLISPCTCSIESDELPILTCSGIRSVRSLSDIFSNKFPSNEFHEIVITESQLGPLPDDVFKGKSFEVIRFSDNRKTSFTKKKIFSSSKSRLTSLTIVQETDKWTFNSINIANFNQLTHLEISGDEMTLTGTLDNPALETLVLRSFLLTNVPAFGKLPALLKLDLDGNAIGTLVPNSFTSMPKLTQLYLGHNKLVSLGASSLTLNDAMTTVDLSGNIISTLQPGWITGVTPKMSLQLTNNDINQLPKEMFQSVVESLLGHIDGDNGEMLIDGNPLECGCDIAWLVTNSSLLNVVRDGRCVNGTRLIKLDPTQYLQNC